MSLSSLDSIRIQFSHSTKPAIEQVPLQGVIAQAMDAELIQVQSEHAATVQESKAFDESKPKLRSPASKSLAEAELDVNIQIIMNLLGPALLPMIEGVEVENSEEVAVENGPSHRNNEAEAPENQTGGYRRFKADRLMQAIIMMISADLKVSAATGKMASQDVERAYADTVRAGQKQHDAARAEVTKAFVSLGASTAVGAVASVGMAKNHRASAKSTKHNAAAAATTSADVNKIAIGKRNALAKAGKGADEMHFKDGTSVKLDRSGDQAKEELLLHDARTAHTHQQHAANDITQHKLQSQMVMLMTLNSTAPGIGNVAGATVNQQVVADNVNADLLKNSAQTRSETSAQGMKLQDRVLAKMQALFELMQSDLQRIAATANAVFGNMRV